MHLLNNLKAILLCFLPSAFAHISKCHINETLNRSKHQQQNLANGVVTNLGMEYVPFVTSQEVDNYVCTIWEMKQ